LRRNAASMSVTTRLSGYGISFSRSASAPLQTAPAGNGAGT